MKAAIEVRIYGIYISAGCHQLLEDLLEAANAGEVERGLLFFVEDVDDGFVVEQDAHELGVAVHRGEVQGGVAVDVASIDVRSCFHQLDYFILVVGFAHLEHFDIYLQFR